MRLIVTYTGQFVEINDPTKHVYAILSHTWDPEGEQSYREVREIQGTVGMSILPESALDEEFYSVLSPELVPCQHVVRLDHRFEPSNDPPASQSEPVDVSSAELNVTATVQAKEQTEELPPGTSTINSALDSCFKKARSLARCIRLKCSLAHIPKRLRPHASPRPVVTASPTGATGCTAPTLTFPIQSPSIKPSSQPFSPSILDHPSISPKIKKACAVARRYGHSLVWIDSCCIEKESSAELSEAINSMFSWYSHAVVCFAYLADFPFDRFDRKKPASETGGTCRWFNRGWTLQELVAPRVVVFLGKDWGLIGIKSSLADILAEVTGIEVDILTHRKRLHEVSVATRMSCASNRKTTRVEDQAYSLFGMFGINLPIIYGEGDRAFLRLQKEILQAIPDQSLFVWSHGRAGKASEVLAQGAEWWTGNQVWVNTRHATPDGLLAKSPNVFHPGAPQLRVVPLQTLAHRLGRPDLQQPSYTFTPHGVHTSLPLIELMDAIPDASILEFRVQPKPVRAPDGTLHDTSTLSSTLR